MPEPPGSAPIGSSQPRQLSLDLQRAPQDIRRRAPRFRLRHVADAAALGVQPVARLAPPGRATRPGGRRGTVAKAFNMPGDIGGAITAFIKRQHRSGASTIHREKAMRDRLFRPP